MNMFTCVDRIGRMFGCERVCECVSLVYMSLYVYVSGNTVCAPCVCVVCHCLCCVQMVRLDIYYAHHTCTYIHIHTHKYIL